MSQRLSRQGSGAPFALWCSPRMGTTTLNLHLSLQKKTWTLAKFQTLWNWRESFVCVVVSKLDIKIFYVLIKNFTFILSSFFFNYSFVNTHTRHINAAMIRYRYCTENEGKIRQSSAKQSWINNWSKQLEHLGGSLAKYENNPTSDASDNRAKQTLHSWNNLLSHNQKPSDTLL